MIETIIKILSLTGALAILLASIGMLRMPDIYLRLSVTTKAATLGIGLILIGGALHFKDVGVTSRSLAILFFVTLTSPISAQLIAKAAYFIRAKMWKGSVLDDLDGMYNMQTHTLRSSREEEEMPEDSEEKKES